MNPSRSGANVRTKRTTTPAEYARPQTGPVTSVNSQQIFHSGANTTGANARINGPNGNGNSNSNNNGNSNNNSNNNGNNNGNNSKSLDIINPPAGSKLTVGNAVALITLRLGRLESFMNQYNLEDQSDEVMRTALARISSLEQKMQLQLQSQSQSQSHHTSSQTATATVKSSEISQLVLSRLDELEKNTTTHTENFLVMSEGLKSLEQSLEAFSEVEDAVDTQPNSRFDDSSLSSLKLEFNSLSEELKETKNLLLKLQSFTMETNAKLVNTIFSQGDHFDIQEFDNGQDEFNRYMCSGTFDAEDYADGVIGLNVGLNEDESSVEDESDVDEDDKPKYSDGNSNAISVNFKEMINQELLGSGC